MTDINSSLNNAYSRIPSPAKAAFAGALCCGLLTHIIAMTGDFPNHDGLGSLYFNQDMITSGRWFLTVTCGISSYFALPWLIGILGMLYIGIAAALITDILEIKSRVSALLTGMVMAAFPVLASTFADVFTMDGYMLGMLMAVAAVFFTKRYRFGWIGGAILLALSLGTYQAYLPVAILLCMYCVFLAEIREGSVKEKLKNILRFLYMGVAGAVLYYGVLKILLAVRGLTLGSYQGMENAGSAGLGAIAGMYRDFIAFTLKSDVIAPNVFAWIAIAALALCACVLFVREAVTQKWYKSISFYLTLILFALVTPVMTNIVLIISPDVTYHAIMRYQYVLFPVIMIAVIDRFSRPETQKTGDEQASVKKVSSGFNLIAGWVLGTAGAVLVFCYAVTDNIGYSNLQKKYERTYAYCVRLLDRIEQTPGYYRGIPVAMIGVVSDEQYPKADLTGGVTDNLIGLSGDYLLYKNVDYELFIKNYLGAELNMITGDEIIDIYNSKEYIEMDSFPAENSVKLVNGKIYVKTENVDYGLRDQLSK
ncbi:MAG: glucosyltransferase domain-containing protein [Lachnospiraceae bacterium]|nr:glucosyltransferase domain-containing protein [Lachnospiraceae bacterium]